MSLQSYSNCRIQYVPKNKGTPGRNYSERSFVELRLVRDTQFAIRALDVEHKTTEIFNIILQNRDQYEFGTSADMPDQVETTDGTYNLWLSPDSRQEFHDTLCEVIVAIFPPESSDSDSSSDFDFSINIPDRRDFLLERSMPMRQSFLERSNSPPRRSLPTRTESPPKQKQAPPLNPAVCNPKDLLSDVHNLNRLIKEGRVDDVGQVITHLVDRHVRVKAYPSEPSRHEDEFQIIIQLDGNEYGINQNGGNIPVNVHPSTTIRELRAAFEIAYQFPPTNQYFFANGKLAQDNWSMKDLYVGPNSLFVLFVLAHTRKFQTKDPWKCSACRMENSPDDLKCRLCTATRIH